MSFPWVVSVVDVLAGHLPKKKLVNGKRDETVAAAGSGKIIPELNNSGILALPVR